MVALFVCGQDARVADRASAWTLAPWLVRALCVCAAAWTIPGTPVPRLVPLRHSGGALAGRAAAHVYRARSSTQHFTQITRSGAAR